MKMVGDGSMRFVSTADDLSNSPLAANRKPGFSNDMIVGEFTFGCN